ncbi:MAG: hypothetical protein U0746_12555 [Gemmataceae bacterium]
MTILALLAALPLVRATYANRRTALIHALGWCWAAWVAWSLAAMDVTPFRCYLAQSLTGCAGVAVLGARRPGVVAWHFVVVGLLVVLLLPAIESVARGATVHLDAPRVAFIVVLLGTVVTNYLPTRSVAGAISLAAGLAIGIEHYMASLVAIFLAPWLAWLGFLRQGKSPAVDARWQDFRDRFGAIWALRVREQFNAAARNSGLAIDLRWTGVRGLTNENDEAAKDLLAALLQRFGLS